MGRGVSPAVEIVRTYCTEVPISKAIARQQHNIRIPAGNQKQNSSAQERIPGDSNLDDRASGLW